VGRLVVDEALGRGYTVIAMVHNHDPFGERAGLKVVKGDIYDAQSVTAVLSNSKAVIICLGSWGQKRRDVMTSAMRAIIPAMKAHGIRRIVTLTGSGAVAPDVKPNAIRRFGLKLLSLFPIGKIFRDGEDHMRLLAKSSLDWTTLRSPVMRDSGNTKYNLSMKVGNHLRTINRRTVAIALVDQLDTTGFIGQAPIIHHG